MKLRVARGVLIGLAVLAVLLLVLLLYPIASALLFAAVLAGAFVPLVDRLARVLRGRRGLAAGVTTAGVAVLIVLPVTLLALVLGRQAIDAVTYVRQVLQGGDVQAAVSRLPPPLRAVVEKLDVPTDAREVQDFAQAQSGRAAAAVGGVIRATSSFLFQVGMFLVALYFMLVDGRALVAWLADVAPIGRDRTYELLRDFRSVSEAVLVSSLATAGVQAAAALVGFLLLHAPQPLFFTLVTFILAFIPVIGATGACLGVAALVALTGDGSRALLLAGWGVAVVGLADNVVKPLMMRGRMEVHGAVIFFALVAGLAAFGPAGLAAGPLIVAFFLAIVRMVRRDFRGSEPLGHAA